MNERISILATYANGTKANYDIYDAVTPLDECFANDEQGLVWYVLELEKTDPDLYSELESAVMIEATSVVYNGSKEVMRCEVTVRDDR